MSPEEQTRTLEARINDPRKIWKLSPMDLKSYSRWYDYSRARGDMFKATDTPWASWHVIRSDDKKRARLNAISHLLSQIPYEDMPREKPILPKRRKPHGYVEPDHPVKFVPELLGVGADRSLSRDVRPRDPPWRLTSISVMRSLTARGRNRFGRPSLALGSELNNRSYEAQSYARRLGIEDARRSRRHFDGRCGQNAIRTPYSLGERIDRLFSDFKFRSTEMPEGFERDGVVKSDSS